MRWRSTSSTGTPSRPCPRGGSSSSTRASSCARCGCCSSTRGYEGAGVASGAMATRDERDAGRRRLVVLALGSFGLLAAHLALVLPVHGFLLSDTTGYLANARWLAG